MKTRTPVYYLMLAGVLLAGPWQLFSAAPEAKPAPAKPAAAKPKLAPRPVPGTTASVPNQAPSKAAPLGAAHHSPNISFSPKPAASKAPASGGAPEARILMIYRSGTFEPLPADPAPPPTAAPLPEEARPESAALSRPGQVRIISKAEADVLAAQPLR